MDSTWTQKVAVTVAGALGVLSNALSGAGGDQGIGGVSQANPTWLTPDGPTFIIWALIFTLVILLVVAQWCPDDETEALLSQRCPLTKLQVRWRITLYLLMNALWPPVFVRSYFFVSLVIICIYLGGLISVLTVLNTRSMTGLCQWVLFAAPNVVHASWVAVATVLNFFTWAGTLGWEDDLGIAGSPRAAMAVVVLLTGVAGVMAVGRWEFAWSAVTAWAVAGIYRMQSGSDADGFPPEALNATLAVVAKWSTVAALLLTAAGALLFIIDSCRPSCKDHRLLPLA